MPATLADLEARVAALGENQRDLTERVISVETRLGAVEAKLDDTSAGVRSLDVGMAEVKDLLVRALERRAAGAARTSTGSLTATAAGSSAAPPWSRRCIRVDDARA